MEEGSRNEKWYLSCFDLIKSRFHPEDMKKFDISDIEIKRVVRIHNRFLRNKFEERVENVIDISNSNYKKNLEYLFYGVDPKSPQEIFRIMEEGYRNPQECQNLGLCPYPPLVNSILAGDLPRINSFLKNNKIRDKFKQSKYLSQNIGDNLNIIPAGYLLICKVFILKGKYDAKAPYFELASSPSENFFSNPVDGSLYDVNLKFNFHSLTLIERNKCV